MFFYIRRRTIQLADHSYSWRSKRAGSFFFFFFFINSFLAFGLKVIDTVPVEWLQHLAIVPFGRICVSGDRYIGLFFLFLLFIFVDTRMMYGIKTD
ncbi:hypothetical protein L873DRAFT_832510 [Choiromyces venosus 120613-1]|uniref:Uncharacterized protein n=1 Tax=Choiromyces venosus 120613-1 TaxID=1336337 RepID=A0A3N4JSB8_9PEZI|nr:hypothetical protein L873DRAFT_832510 [Choiromyces venosus 120613-1]